jgi:hypothetical protein
MMNKPLVLALVTACGIMSASPIVDSNLILIGPIDFGHGFGNAPRILTMQATGNQTVESGCDGVSGTTLIVGPSSCAGLGAFAPVGGDEPNPNGFPKYADPTLGSLNYSDASQIEVLFDAVDPGNTTGNPVTMSQLVLKIYGPTGTLLLADNLVNPGLILNPTVTGNGRFDYGFGLDAAGIALLNSTIFSRPGFGNDFLTLEATSSAVHGGPESFYAASSLKGGFLTTTPEPGTWAMLACGTGLLALSFLFRRSAK